MDRFYIVCKNSARCRTPYCAVRSVTARYLEVVAERDDDDGRGSKIILDSNFLAHLEELWQQVKAGTYPRTFGTKHSLKTFGKLLGEVTGQAWSDGSLTRFFKGEQVTDHLTAALCEFFGLDYPVYSAADPDEARWFSIGRRLRELDPDVFADALEKLGQHVEQSEQQREARQKLRSTLQNLQTEGVVEGKSEPRSIPGAAGRRSRRVDRDR